MNKKTIFDKIIAKEIPAEIVYEDDSVLAFKDINPQAPVHVLVIPKNKISEFTEFKDVDARTAGVLLRGAAKTAGKLGLDEKGYRVVFNCGKFGQQTVKYVHAHILGERQMNWPPG